MSNLNISDLSEPLRQLTYLQLCVVPAFIEPYLSQLSPHELKCTFFMYMQTFFEVASDNYRVSNLGEPASIIPERSQRPIARQMIHLLKKTLAYYINKDYPLHTFFLEFDPNIDASMVNLQKILLKQLDVDNKYKDCLQIILLCLDLTYDLCEIKRGNAKFLLNFSGKTQNFEQQAESENLRKKNHSQVVAEVTKYQKQVELTSNLNEFCAFCLNLAGCYQYVVLSKPDKDVKPSKQSDAAIKQRDFDAQSSSLNHELYDCNFWYLSLEADTYQMISSNYISLLKNFNDTSLISIEKLKNSAIVLVNRLTQSKSDTDFQYRIDAYTLLLAIKLIYSLKSDKNNTIEPSQGLEELFKQVMQFQVASIRSTFYFLAAYLQLDFEIDIVHTMMVKLIGWVMSQYRKYNFKNEEMIYADFIASSLDLLVSWKLSQKPQQGEKQVQTVLNRLASKTKVHGQNSFGLFFQTLNGKLLEYVVTNLLKARGNPTTSLKAGQNSELVDLGLLKFQQKILFYITSNTYQEVKQRSKELQTSESTLNYVYLIYFTYRQKTTKSEVIIARLYNLLRTICQTGKNEFRKESIQYQANRCLSDLYTTMISSISILQLEYSIVSNKKNQAIYGNLNENPEVQKATNFIQQAFHPLVFLNTTIFSLDPPNNRRYLLQALVLDSYCQESLAEQILQFYDSAKASNKIVWDEDDIQILRYSRKYDTLEIFYEDILLKSDQDQNGKGSKIKAFKKFSKQWCSQENNYQWLSDQKTSRIRLFTLKSLSVKAQLEIE